MADESNGVNRAQIMNASIAWVERYGPMVARVLIVDMIQEFGHKHRQVIRDVIFDMLMDRKLIVGTDLKVRVGN